MNYYSEIKTELINNEITKRVKDYSKNKSDLTTYYNVGKLLSDAGKHYGEGIIKEYSIKLTNELGKGYNITSLKRMRKFYIVIQKGAPLVHQLSWSNYIELLPLNDINKETRTKLTIQQNENLIDFVKNPIVIKNTNNYTKISEKILQKLITENIKTFMKEL